MPLTAILVHLDSTPLSASRLALAIAFAAKYGARLSGIYADPAGPHNGAEIATTLFLDETTQAGVRAEWLGGELEVGGDAVQIINYHGRATDLVIVGQAPAKGKHAKGLHDLPERLIKSCGRPILIVPRAGSFTSCGERILVAWNNGREAARALHDAIPILMLAQKVQLLRILMARDSGTPSGIPETIVAFLANHGIKARPEEIFAPGYHLGDILLNRACEEGSDLLVMGAYGPSITGKLVLGNAARHVLDNMAMPVLMSH